MSGESCKNLEDCPQLQQKLKILKSKEMSGKATLELYKEVNSKLCSANIRRVCC